MKANFKELDKLTNQGFLRSVISPQKDLILYNYTDSCTYSRNWNKYTKNARGTVYDLETGEVVALAFPKFMNFEELTATEQRRILKLKKFTAYEKMDGSLGIVFHYKGRWYLNTRGSFSSPQALEGLRLLNNKYNKDLLNKNYTYLCEIITPETKIILDYKGEEMLSCLAIMDVKNLKELEKEEYIKEADRVGFPRPKIYEFNSIEEIIDWKKSLGADNEGTVVQYHFSGKIHRVKFKSNKYLEVAKILSNVNYLSVWANMIFGKVSESYLEAIPEEFRYTLDKQQVELEAQFLEKYTQMLTEFKSLEKGSLSPKEFAEVVKGSTSEYKATFYTLNKIIPSEEDLATYRKIVEAEAPEARILKDVERTGNIGPDELRVKFRDIIFKESNSKLKQIYNIEDFIMKRMRPSGNNFED